MPYSLVSTRVLPKHLAAQWQDINAGGMIVATLVATYREIFLTLLPEGETEVVYVDFRQLVPEYATYGNTLNVLLQVLGDRALDAVPSLPDAVVDYVSYSDAIRVGYKAQYAVRGIEVPATYPKEAMGDLKITRPNTNTDVTLLHSHCLVSVNGYHHLTDTDGTSLWVVDGGKSMRYLNRNHFGITSFLKLGALTKLSLDDAWVQLTPTYENLKDRISLVVPESFTPKSFLLVLGGYLVLPEDGVFWQVGAHEYQLDLKRLFYIERLLESRVFLDLGSLKLTPGSVNPASLNLEEAWSDAVIRRYFQLSQTFLVGVDRANLFYSKKSLRQFNEPGLFTSIQEPTQSLLVGYGRTAEYWKRLEDQVWAVTAEDNWLRNYMFKGQNENTLENVTDALANDRPTFISQAALLELGAYGAKE